MNKAETSDRKECPDCGIDIEVDATLLNAYDAGCVYCEECADQRLGVEND